MANKRHKPTTSEASKQVSNSVISILEQQHQKQEKNTDMTIKLRITAFFALIGIYSISSLLAPAVHIPHEVRKTMVVLEEESSSSLPHLPKIAANTTLIHNNTSLQNHIVVPPLKSLVNLSTNEIKGDVQFLLDYAVIGFAKCGSTTLSLWLDKHPEISDFPYEVWDLYHGRNVNFIQRMHKKRRAQEILSKESHQPHYGRIMHGYKCPGDITRQQPLNTLTQYFPKTKLIITMRHPILFFQSFYNYRASLKQFHRIPGTPNDLIGPEKEHDVLATAQSAFHVFLASLGKTNMTTNEERQLLKGFYKDELLDTKPATMLHKVFLMEMTQLADKNETRSEIFRKDLQNFLGLKHPLPLIPHHRPNANHEKRFKQHVQESGKKIDICDHEHLEARQELLRISRAASQWIRNYFISSSDVVVSSPTFFDEALKSWMVDPCDVKQNVSEALLYNS